MKHPTVTGFHSKSESFPKETKEKQEGTLQASGTLKQTKITHPNIYVTPHTRTEVKPTFSRGLLPSFRNQSTAQRLCGDGGKRKLLLHTKPRSTPLDQAMQLVLTYFYLIYFKSENANYFYKHV